MHADANAAYQQARLDLEYSKIVAPYDAVVLQVMTAPGEIVVSQDQPKVLVELARSDEMLARAYVSGEQLAKLKIGQQVDTAFRGQWLKAQVHSLSLQPVANDANAAGYSVNARLVVEATANPRAGEASAIRFAD